MIRLGASRSSANSRGKQLRRCQPRNRLKDVERRQRSNRRDERLRSFHGPPAFPNRKWLVIGGLIAAFLRALSITADEGAENTEFRVKAAYLFNFAKFVEWPSREGTDSKGPIVFGVLGQDPFGEILDQALKGKTVSGRQLIIKRFTELKGINECHILFVSKSEKEKLGQIFEALKGLPVVTVSDIDGFCTQGGIFRFLLQNNKVVFEVNNDAAKKVLLMISSKLLQVGIIVKTDTIQGTK